MNHFAVWFYPDADTNQAAGWKMPVKILWIGPEHTVTKSAALPTLRPYNDNPWPDKLAATLVPPSVLAYRAFLYSDKDIVIHGWRNAVLAALCAVLSWPRARRYNFSNGAIAGWALFIFLFGVAGLLGFLCVQEWPAREACPSCKKLRVVDRETCEHCQSPFSPAEKNGTEIFVPLVKV
jgi:hypothetical protein